MSEWFVLIKDVDTKPFIKAYDEAEKFETDITDRSTQGNNSIQYTVTADSLKPLTSLFHSYIKKIQGVGHRNFKDPNAWCVEGDKGSWHRTHNHSVRRLDDEPEEGVACVLYLNVPQSDDRGEFFYMIHTEKETQLNCLMPNKGDLIIMPKSVWHGVYPQTSEGLRRTLNLDLSYA